MYYSAIIIAYSTLLILLLNTATSGAVISPKVINRQNHIVRRRQIVLNPCINGRVGFLNQNNGITNQTSQNNTMGFRNTMGNVPGSMFDSSTGQMASWTGPSTQNSVTLDTADGGNFLNGNCCYSNGIIYDASGSQTAATEQQKAQLTQYRFAWSQWFNQEMARQFPPGFPFNMPQTLPPAAPEPLAPCFCPKC